MCNLYSMTRSRAAIVALARAMRDRTGNQPGMPGIYPDYWAPIVRVGTDGQREVVSARWGMPSSRKALLEAATKLNIRKVIIASSETTYGIVFNHTHRDPEYFPLDEDYPVDPRDSYATSKICNERTAQAFAGRSGADIYAIRIGNVIEPHEYENFPKFFKTPDFRKRIAWSYINARDLGQIVRRGIETDGLGFQIFNAANDDVSSDLPTRELLKRY